MADLVQHVLEYIDQNWDERNYQPKPILYHDEDKRRLDTDVRTKKLELSENNIVTVGSQPSGSNEPLGFDFNYKSRTGVQVEIEAVHDDRGGHVANASEFKDGLVAEVARTINVERRWPSGLQDAGYYTLYISDEDNKSSGSMNYYHLVLTVQFIGNNRLPESSIQ